MTWKYDGQIIDESDIYDIVRDNYDYDAYDETLDDCYETVKIPLFYGSYVAVRGTL